VALIFVWIGVEV